MENIQQERAKFAIEQLEKISINQVIDKDTATFIVGMPNMILSNGIGQTMAFLLAKNDKEKKVYKILKNWICKKYANLGFTDKSDMDFIKTFCTLKQDKYLEIQRECLRLCEWLKRYARAFQEEDKDKQ
ncbi:MAG: type III-B CRISPR module-associated protein Cmr5 [Spirochaetia bacterium]|nr:type III-B CRISPR module-associated protein Cmr5 [Spirochaetia bacterium]